MLRLSGYRMWQRGEFWESHKIYCNVRGSAYTLKDGRKLSFLFNLKTHKNFKGGFMIFHLKCADRKSEKKQAPNILAVSRHCPHGCVAASRCLLLNARTQIPRCKGCVFVYFVTSTHATPLSTYWRVIFLSTWALGTFYSCLNISTCLAAGRFYVLNLPIDIAIANNRFRWIIEIVHWKKNLESRTKYQS